MVYQVEPIGTVESSLAQREDAPRQPDEGAPPAWLLIETALLPALQGIVPGDDIILVTWLDRAQRDVLSVHPRGDLSRPEQGVFSTRSPDRPNPLGLHRVTVTDVDGACLRVSSLEALDGTPILDIKPVLAGAVQER